MKLFRHFIALLAIIALQACGEKEYYNIETPETTATVELSGAVDLGLSVKWAACDLGANTPYVSGDDVYGYKMENQTGNVCGTELDPATNALGAPWRLPSRQQFEELIADCKWRYGEFHNVWGWFVTGPSGKCIFLKSDTRWSGTGDLTFYVLKADEYSYYLSSEQANSIFKARPVCD